MDWITIVVSLAVSLASVITDLCWKRIPNWITFPAMLFGIVYAFFVSPINALGRLLVLAALFTVGILGILGLGDLKYLMAVAALNGFLCTSITLAIGSLLLLFKELMFSKKETLQDIRAGLFSFTHCFFDPRLGTGRKTIFLPYLAVGLIGGILICLFI